MGTKSVFKQFFYLVISALVNVLFRLPTIFTIEQMQILLTLFQNFNELDCCTVSFSPLMHENYNLFTHFQNSYQIFKYNLIFYFILSIIQSSIHSITGPLAERLLVSVIIPSLRGRERTDVDLLPLVLNLAQYIFPIQSRTNQLQLFHEEPLVKKFLSDLTIVSAILETLKHEIPSIRLQAIRLVTGCARINLKDTAAAIVSCKGALSRLVEVLEDNSEEYLPDSLQMLRILTAGSAEICSLVAFQVCLHSFFLFL